MAFKKGEMKTKTTNQTGAFHIKAQLKHHKSGPYATLNTLTSALALLGMFRRELAISDS